MGHVKFTFTWATQLIQRLPQIITMGGLDSCHRAVFGYTATKAAVITLEISRY